MQIESISITNYKSFLQRQTILLEPGFNVLLGTNNAGKTTVLDVLDMDLGRNEPHRSKLTLPTYGGQTTQNSALEISFSTHFEELWRLAGAAPIFLPLHALGTHAERQEKKSSLENFIARNGAISLTSLISNNAESVSFEGENIINGTVSRNNPNQTTPSAYIYFDSNLSAPQIEIGQHGATKEGLHNLLVGTGHATLTP